MQVCFLRDQVMPLGAAFARLSHMLLILLAFLLAADRYVEKDGADANADIDTGASAPAATTAVAVIILTSRGAARMGAQRE